VPVIKAALGRKIVLMKRGRPTSRQPAEKWGQILFSSDELTIKAASDRVSYGFVVGTVMRTNVNTDDQRGSVDAA
jgi:hypothetical protein